MTENKNSLGRAYIDSVSIPDGSHIAEVLAVKPVISFPLYRVLT